jgi:predicted amino acid dehydrogenase
VLGNLETLSDSSFLPEELRTRAQVAAVRVAEAAMQLEELLRAIANEKGATGAPPPLDR